MPSVIFPRPGQDGAAGAITADLVATSNLTLSGEQTIDGVLTSASRVLLVGQTTGSQNGIWVTASGAWTRATDYDSSAEVLPGGIVVVLGGLAYAISVWILITTGTINVGSTSLSYIRHNPMDPSIYGNGMDGVLTYSGNTTLTNDLLAETITVQSGVFLNTGGLSIRARKWIRIESGATVGRNGNNASGSTAGSAFAVATVGAAGLAGGAGGTAPSTAGSAGSGNNITGYGGKGGSGGSGSGAGGGAGGTQVAQQAVRTRPQANAFAAMLGMINANILNLNQTFGGSGGGGGGPGAAANGGGGGAGGTYVSLAAPVIYLDGAIECNGGNGAAGTGSGGGGGGGGGGGIIAIVSDRAPIGSGSLSVAGGSGGASGGGAGAAGSAGATGVLIKLWPGSTP